MFTICTNISARAIANKGFRNHCMHACQDKQQIHIYIHKMVKGNAVLVSKSFTFDIQRARPNDVVLRVFRGFNVK